LSITQTVLVFVAIPALVVALIYGLVYGSTARRVSKRYRPGRPFSFAPVWFLAATGPHGPAESGAPAIGAGEQHPALPPPGPLLAAADDAASAAVAHGVTGGASDSW
jgi:hypothetical protein